MAVGQRQAVDQRDADHSPPRTCGINAICTSSTGSLSGRLDDIPDQNAQRRAGFCCQYCCWYCACWACNCAWYCIAGRPATAPGTALAGPASAPGTAAAALGALLFLVQFLLVLVIHLLIVRRRLVLLRLLVGWIAWPCVHRVVHRANVRRVRVVGGIETGGAARDVVDHLTTPPPSSVAPWRSRLTNVVARRVKAKTRTHCVTLVADIVFLPCLNQDCDWFIRIGDVACRRGFPRARSARLRARSRVRASSVLGSSLSGPASNASAGVTWHWR